MVTTKEYSQAPENSIFVYKPTGVKQPKAIIRFKMNQIGQAYCQGARVRDVTQLRHELKVHLNDLIGEALEQFELVDEVIPIQEPATKPAQVQKSDQLCYKCGLNREDCIIIEEAGKVMRVCLECRGN